MATSILQVPRSSSPTTATGSGALSVPAPGPGSMTDCSIELAVVADLNTDRARELVGAGVEVTSDGFALVANPNVDVVVELIGGTKIAKELVLKAIENGKHVVTANKALIATSGNEIFAKAREKGVMVAYEAQWLVAFPSSKRFVKAWLPTRSNGSPALSTVPPTLFLLKCATKAPHLLMY